MSSSLNKVQIIGNITADAEIRETPSGQKVAIFSVATNRKWKDSSGVIQEDAEFHNCVAWRALADIVEQYTSKGKKVYVEGYLKTRTWEDTAGVKRYKTEIVADNVILLGSPNSQKPSAEDTPERASKTSKSSITHDEEEFPADDSAYNTKKAEEAKKKKKPKAEEEISIEDIPF